LYLITSIFSQTSSGKDITKNSLSVEEDEY